MNQVWNWVRGEGASWARERVPLVYWSARAEEVCGPAGATVGEGEKGEISFEGEGKGRERGMGGGKQDGAVQMSLLVEVGVVEAIRVN